MTQIPLHTVFSNKLIECVLETSLCDVVHLEDLKRVEVAQAHVLSTRVAPVGCDSAVRRSSASVVRFEHILLRASGVLYMDLTEHKPPVYAHGDLLA